MPSGSGLVSTVARSESGKRDGCSVSPCAADLTNDILNPPSLPPLPVLVGQALLKRFRPPGVVTIRVFKIAVRQRSYERQQLLRGGCTHAALRREEDEVDKEACTWPGSRGWWGKMRWRG